MSLNPLKAERSIDPFDAASGVIRAYCRWHVAPACRHQVKISPLGSRTIILPTLKLRELHSLVVDGTDLTNECDWDENGVIILRSGTFPDRPGSVSVDMTHGYDLTEVPEVLDLAAQIAARARVASEHGTGVISQGAGPFTVRHATRIDGQVGGTALFEGEKTLLSRYRLMNGNT